LKLALTGWGAKNLKTSPEDSRWAKGSTLGFARDLALGFLLKFQNRNLLDLLKMKVLILVLGFLLEFLCFGRIV
jgi:hypothetical protein